MSTGFTLSGNLSRGRGGPTAGGAVKKLTIKPLKCKRKAHSHLKVMFQKFNIGVELSVHLSSRLSPRMCHLDGGLIHDAQHPFVVPLSLHSGMSVKRVKLLKCDPFVL